MKDLLKDGSNKNRHNTEGLFIIRISIGKVIEMIVTREKKQKHES